VSPEKLFASIDIGTNSALLLIASSKHGRLEPVVQKVAAPRVGRGLSATGRISEESFQALMTALAGFLAEIGRTGAHLVGAVATEAFRKAANGLPLLAQITAALRCECRILSGEEESRLGYLAVHNRHPLPDLTVLDVGGGSTETTSASGGTSLPIGAVALLEACGHDADACRKKARGVFANAARRQGGPGSLVAVGGTATALAMLEMNLAVFDAAAIEGAEFPRAAVTRQIARLASLSESERAALPGLGPGRADILMPGLCILESFLEASGRAGFRVSDRGIRYGIILDALEKA
jgi:exopolyphosphatase/guanosine-5'-triphosphate,3'-diphosphate pyrophosphatase